MSGKISHGRVFCCRSVGTALKSHRQTGLRMIRSPLQNHSFSNRRLLSRLFVLWVVLCCLGSAAFAVQPGPNANAVDVSLQVAALDQIAVGDQFSFSLPTSSATGGHSLLQVTAIVEDDDYYINGDRVIFARGIDDARSSGLRLVLTVGESAVFAEITLAQQRWVFDARQHGEVISGQLYQPDHTAVHSHQSHSPDSTDFVIPDLVTPDGVRRPVSPDRPAQQLHLGTEAVAGSTNGPAQAASSTLEISQTFSRTAVYVGQSSEVEVTLQFRNTGGQHLSRLAADVYFILEDTELISAPACTKILTNTSPRQPVLRCELSGGIAAGASRTLSYQVRVPPKSVPMRLWSTVFVGAQRHDANLNVVNNITSDAPADGLGTFNQGLLPELTNDRLGNVVIDVMMLYTPDAEALYGAATATRINQLISISNQIYQDSGVRITLRPVHHGRVNYQSAGVDMYRQLDELTTGNHPAFNQVSALRERYGADLVVLLRPMNPQSDMCGLANLGGYRTMGDMLAFNERDYAYSLVAIDCPVSSVLAHELGHNMGLTHSHREDGEGGTFPFATGHGVEGQFTTVMATPGRFGGASRIARFSDPRALCKALPCGVDYNNPDHAADAVLALNLVRFQIASYMPTKVPLLPGRRVGMLNGGATAAHIAMAASTDKGLSYVESVTPSQRMDITADFYVDPAHVGRRGQFHVLADLSAAGLGMVQLNERGELFGWNGSVANLVPFSAPAALKPVEYLRILSDFAPVPELHGFPMVLFLAYQLPDSGELIYTLEPLIVNISGTP